MPAKARIGTKTQPPADGGRHSRDPAGERRSFGRLATIPLVLISTIAIALNLASPADAATITKKPLKSRSTLPGVAPATAARGQVARASAEATPTQYTVVDGDTVSAVAGRFGLSTASVLALNGLGWSAVIFPGQTLTLSGGTAPAVAAPTPVAAEITRYTIVTGDTISGIASAHGLSVGAILSANGLAHDSIIFPGQAIVLPGAAAPAATPAAAAPQPAAASAGTHTIVTGDTIGAIAAAAGVSVQSVLDANGLGWSSIIYPGQVLAVPSLAISQVSSVSAAPIDASPLDAAVFIEPVVSAGSVTPLTDEMRRNARIIVSVGRAAGVGDAGLVIALAAAAQESGLRNVHYGDRDSLGLFQQRPSSGWGSAEQVLDPLRASRAFFGGPGNPNPGITRGLLDIPGWEQMTVTQAAQAVQISAFPDHYAKWETSAAAWLPELD
ncbi:LysM peptidoglycan-binding domain-containing protein [Cryobacterium sp. PH31-AA6]|uniref:LysM peptidoglycan-binding domain-containing protein n=1 Tax=Cryobacterium sp. PH31-AA6 TaxID=3046205 RepID=UPI0024B94AA5|nr:LysM peptidoglycan-binding domain-containing protein [Cryobacterium sp. PH31-AA6]MDJ0323579.1 LysM peptidoglycan-binding domain-containing protein [Cryobacterium sp. PH31-AA6]